MISRGVIALSISSKDSAWHVKGQECCMYAFLLFCLSNVFVAVQTKSLIVASGCYALMQLLTQAEFGTFVTATVGKSSVLDLASTLTLAVVAHWPYLLKQKAIRITWSAHSDM
eukprot:4855444-Amphidinium_carterae.1